MGPKWPYGMKYEKFYKGHSTTNTKWNLF